MENKNTIIIAGVIIVVIVAAAAFLFMRGGSGTPQPAPQSSNTPSQPAQSSMSLAELFSKSLSQSCTFSQSSNGENTNGTIYMTTGHLRGDFTSQTTNGQTVQSHMITDGMWSYVWTDQPAQGFKMTFTTSPSPQQSQKSGVDINQKVDYSCNSWTPDQSEFTLPSNITFMDVNAAPAATGNSAGGSAGVKTGGGSLQCSACATLPAAQQAACKAALGCQ